MNVVYANHAGLSPVECTSRFIVDLNIACMKLKIIDYDGIPISGRLQYKLQVAYVPFDT